MNTVGDDLTPLIDRLVDGECDESERRALLLRLESEPDGWRRCALAFLEDQAFRSVLSGPVAAVPLIASEATRPLIRKTSRRLPRWALAASLIAATFVAGFTLGGASGGGRSIEIAQPHNRPPGPDRDPADGEIRKVGWASLRFAGRGEETERLVPILAGPGLDEQWLESRPPAIPEYVRAQWERDGYQVAERRQLLSLNLDDGRRMAIPVEDVELEYVGQVTY